MQYISKNLPVLSSPVLTATSDHSHIPYDKHYLGGQEKYQSVCALLSPAVHLFWADENHSYFQNSSYSWAHLDSFIEKTSSDWLNACSWHSAGSTPWSFLLARHQPLLSPSQLATCHVTANKRGGQWGAAVPLMCPKEFIWFLTTKTVPRYLAHFVFRHPYHRGEVSLPLSPFEVNYDRGGERICPSPSPDPQVLSSYKQCHLPPRFPH